MAKIIIDEQKMWLDAPAWEFVGITSYLLSWNELSQQMTEHK